MRFILSLKSLALIFIAALMSHIRKEKSQDLKANMISDGRVA